MDINVNDETSFTVIMTALITAAMILACYGCSQQEQTKREAIKAGLVEESLPGQQRMGWTKPKNQ